MTVTSAQSQPLDAIRQSLQTDIIEVLQSHIDVLRPVSRNDAYEIVMNEPHVLSGCFSIFRAHPEYFRHLITGPDGAPVDIKTSDNAMLRCGRTLADAVALVVRTATKRYFRRTVGVKTGAAPDQFSRKRADELYTAIADYVRYEWQTTLIPSYARLSVPTVNLLKDRILEFREPSEIIGLAENPPPAGSPLPPMLLDRAERVFNPNRGSLNPEALWKVCQQMDMGRLYPGVDAKALQLIVAQIVTAQPEALEIMMPVLGSEVRRFCVFLFVVHAEFGQGRFQSIFGPGGQLHILNRWMARLLERPVPVNRLTELRAVYRDIITQGATSELDEKKAAKQASAAAAPAPAGPPKSLADAVAAAALKK